MQIRYNLYKLENALTFQVSSQSEALTKYLQSEGKFVAFNGWKIRTRHYPGIDMATSTIYLRGTTSVFDTKPASVFGITNDYRDALVDEIYSAIQEFVTAAIDETNQIEYHTIESSATSNSHVDTITV